MISFSKFFKENQFSQVAALLLLLLLLAIGGVPGYLTGYWQWKQPLPVTTLKELKQIRNTGLALPGWQTTEQAEQEIGEHKWSLQTLKKEGSQSQAILLLLPQNGPMDQPEVEWTDVNGWGRSRWGKWDVAQSRSAKFTVKPPGKLASNVETIVEARFFRAVTPQQTFAVLQWYAMPDGGNPSPFHWFLADQLAQWRKQRIPWVSVSILIPMEPLGQVETSWSLAKSMGETVQSALMAGPL
ncbi:MAG: cyanoexosortase B system-associated protein [Nostoc sp. NMS1]|uniref:cyanoexosortase B system-associated protein n=1 Tax=unclassified Nostoc TaxID=2593658 RepID=UPI0025D6D039|nr:MULTISPECIES: cyanoexosortase B system-associated protein [unclassified Nostoc]MBN3907351.1 cyanoexosortase B system-associated protein [Nostoc sp. NMS1]MBN3989114.1 cyanoexosortase B system-associated protein [Nostoc sp. NMS2]